MSEFHPIGPALALYAGVVSLAVFAAFWRREDGIERKVLMVLFFGLALGRFLVFVPLLHGQRTWWFTLANYISSGLVGIGSTGMLLYLLGYLRNHRRM